MNRAARRKHLQATGSQQLLNIVGRFDFIKAEQGSKHPKLKVVAYNGGELRLEGFQYPIVIDLASTAVAPRVSVLWSHNRELILGQFENLGINGGAIEGVAVLSGEGDKANEVRTMTLNGYQWNVSAGTESRNMTLVESGSRQINGRTFTAPFYHARENTVREVSLLSIGADQTAFATLLAATFPQGDFRMETFELFCTSLGLDITKMGDSEKAIAQKIYDNMKAAKAKLDANAANNNLNATNGNGSTVPVVTPPDITSLVAEAMKQFRTAMSEENQRVDKINKLSASYSNPDMFVDGKKVNIAAHAIANGWDEIRTENALMKNARITHINAGGRNGNDGSNGPERFVILAAATAVAGKLKNPEKHFSVEVLDAAHKEFKGRIGLQQLLLEAAYANGYSGKSTNFKANIRAILQAAFSTVEISDMLTNNTNKYMREGFMSVDDSWRLLAAIRNVSDFKEVTGYRGVGSFRFEEVAPDGQIPHGTMSSKPYTNRVKTHAKMLGITRVDMINDDLGVITSVPRGLGRGGKLALIHVFWTEFMDNGTFFAAGNNNVSTGALGLTGLAAALAVFDKQKDENLDYVMATPRYLVVPTELKPIADDLYTQTNLVGGGTTTFGQNRYAGKYIPVSSPYLSDTRFTGNSTTAYYLIADPNDIPVIEVAFLDGQEEPTVESADADFDQLGIQMRGYYDFGAKKQEPRGGVRSTGV